MVIEMEFCGSALGAERMDRLCPQKFREIFRGVDICVLIPSTDMNFLDQSSGIPDGVNTLFHHLAYSRNFEMFKWHGGERQ